MKIEQALKIKQNWTAEQARNDLERLLLRDERPANKVIALACKTLEKQMPKAVVYNIFKSNGWGNVECKCPICDSVLAGENWADKHYCDKCGQALDWSDSK